MNQGIQESSSEYRVSILAAMERLDHNVCRVVCKAEMHQAARRLIVWSPTARLRDYRYLAARILNIVLIPYPDNLESTMVLPPFGFGVGDVLAVAKLAGKIASELKDV